MLKFVKYAAFLTILLASVAFFAQQNAVAQDTVRVIFVKGDPKVMGIDAEEWVSCKLGMAVNNGDRIKTAREEAVEMSFAADNSKIIKVEGDSDVIVKKGQAPYSVELLNGALMSLIKKLPRQSKFEIRTPAGISGARGTGWRSQTSGDRATFEAHEESIYTKGVDKLGNEMEGELTVDSGWKTTIDRFERPTGLDRLTGADSGRWNSWKEDVRGRLEKTQDETVRSGGGGAAPSGGGTPTAERTKPSSDEKAVSEEKKTAPTEKADRTTVERVERHAVAERQIESTEGRKEDTREMRTVNDIEKRLEPSTSSRTSNSTSTDRCLE